MNKTLTTLSVVYPSVQPLSKKQLLSLNSFTFNSNSVHTQGSSAELVWLREGSTHTHKLCPSQHLLPLLLIPILLLENLLEQLHLRRKSNTRLVEQRAAEQQSTRPGKPENHQVLVAQGKVGFLFVRQDNSCPLLPSQGSLTSVGGWRLRGGVTFSADNFRINIQNST